MPFLTLLYWLVLLLALSSMGGVTTIASAQTLRNTVGKVMPADAAPLEQQIYRFLLVEPTTLDVNIALYQAQSGIFIFEGLIRLDQNDRLTPAAADRWETSPDGRRWTFYLRKGARWSDGRPVTAHDFEYTYRRMLDPASGNVYAFFYYPLKGARAFNQGRSSDPNSVGVKAVDDYTLVIETEGPCPYLPYLTAFPTSGPVPRWQVEKYGPKWTEEGHCVSNSTFKLDRWKHGDRLEFVLDPNYNGPHKAYVERIVGKVISAVTEAGTLAYENNEVDYQTVTPTDIPRLRNHPVLGRELHIYADFSTSYLIFDTRHPPFDDLRVRQAISHVIDREILCTVVMQGTGSPAYSMLPPGYPGHAEGRFKSIQRFDPQLARRLLSEAGYPGGRGFPSREMWVTGAQMRNVAQAIQQMLKQHLNIDVDIRELESGAYRTAMYQWQMPLGLATFQYDYPDPNNMLAMVWHSQPRGYSRQDWHNPEFDRLVDLAAAEMDSVKRFQMYDEAQRILVEDVGGVFLYHGTLASLRKPWLKGIKRDKNGNYHIRALNTSYMDLYIGKEKPGEN